MKNLDEKINAEIQNVRKNVKYVCIETMWKNHFEVGEKIEFTKIELVKTPDLLSDKNGKGIQVSYTIFDVNNEKYNSCTNHYYSLNNWILFMKTLKKES